MEQRTIKLPIEWYIARIAFLNKHLHRIPNIHLGKHRNRKVLRVYKSEDKHKYKEVHQSSKHWDQTYQAYIQREKIQSQIDTLSAEMKFHYNTTYEKEHVHWEIIPNQNNKLNNEFYYQIKDNECSYEKSNEYEFDGHNFRSRFEMAVAKSIKDLHLNYKYDAGVHLHTQKDYPDFTLAFPEFNRCVFLEVMGALDQVKYVDKNSNKFKEFSLAGYCVGSDLFIIGANEHTMPNPAEVDQMIIYIVSSLCAKYVRRIL